MGSDPMVIKAEDSWCAAGESASRAERRPWSPRVAIVHDYLTQRGGAERVVLSMLEAFPDAPVYTSLYDPAGTYPEFREVDIRTSPLNDSPLLRRRHRLALPFLAKTFSSLRVDADVVICSSSGWAHGAHTSGRKLVYCYTPAHWLYQGREYNRSRRLGRVAMWGLGPSLRRWDRRAARSADRFVVPSAAVRARVERIYGIEPEVVWPPGPADASGQQNPVPGIDPGFMLCVSRLVPQKNVDAVVSAFDELDDERLVVVGTGPEEARLRAMASRRVTFLGAVGDSELRWLYEQSVGLVTASHEDFGITPLEAGTFGRPTAALAWGGHLETLRDRETGVLFEHAERRDVAAAVRRLMATSWNRSAIQANVRRFSNARFIARLQEIVAEELDLSHWNGAPAAQVAAQSLRAG